MKFKNYTKMFLFMVSLAFGIGFCHSVSAKSTYVDYDGTTIQWDIVDAGPSIGGKQLNIYGDLKMFSKFGNTIREKCEKESIDLKSVLVLNGLGYFVMPNNTLWVQPTPKCSDPNIKYCMIEALNLDFSGKRSVTGLTFKDNPVVPEYITFREKEGKFYASSPWLTQRSETYEVYDAKSRKKAVSQEAPAAAREERAERKVAVSKKSTAAVREEREEIEKERRIKVLESKISHISAEISRLEALQIGEDEKRDRARRERKSCYSFDYRESIRKFRVNLKAAELERDRLLRD